MAQKPNSNNTSKDTNEIDLSKETIDIKDSKKIGNTTNKSDIKNNLQPQKPHNKKQAGKGSPRTQRGKVASVDNGKNKPVETCISSSNSVSMATVTTTTVPLKETYASKFGTNTDAKTVQPQRPKTNTTTTPSTNPISTNKVAVTTATKVNASLSAPRPLMSQVINPPASKLNEVHELQQQQQQTQKSFSDTVKKTGGEVASFLSSEKTESVNDKNDKAPTPTPTSSAATITSTNPPEPASTSSLEEDKENVK